MTSDEEKILILGGLWFLSELGDLYAPIKASMERGGASLYETVHPSERRHMNDEPSNALSISQLRTLAAQAGFSESAARTAAAIAKAESGGFPDITGDKFMGKGKESIGLWQINLKYHPQYSAEALRDPLTNAQAAYHISNGGKNWKFWSTWWADPKRKIGPGLGSYQRFV